MERALFVWTHNSLLFSVHSFCPGAAAFFRRQHFTHTLNVLSLPVLLTYYRTFVFVVTCYFHNPGAILSDYHSL